MLDIDKATEQELRQYLVDNGSRDYFFVKSIHPKSKELRDAGFNEQADLLDSYYAKEKGAGKTHVLTGTEVKAKVKEMIDAKYQRKAGSNNGRSSPQPGVRQEGGYTTVRGERIQRSGHKDGNPSKEEEEATGTTIKRRL